MPRRDRPAATARAAGTRGLTSDCSIARSLVSNASFASMDAAAEYDCARSNELRVGLKVSPPVLLTPALLIAIEVLELDTVVELYATSASSSLALPTPRQMPDVGRP